MMIDLPTQHVSRVFILPMEAFHYLKTYQRALHSRTGQHHDNSQTLTKMMAEHQAHVGLTGKPHTVSPVAALLKPSMVATEEGQE